VSSEREAPQSATAGAGEPRVAWSAIVARMAVVAALVVADLWSKAAVFAALSSGVPKADCHYHNTPRLKLIGNWFAFMLSWNPGMAWGFDKLPPWLLVGGRIAAVGFLAWLVARTPRARRWLVIAFVLILAGALGNLYDNLFLAPRRAGATFGEVRDFIDVYFTRWDWHFPTFNVADSCITVGAVLLFLTSFSKERREAPAGTAQPADVAGG
jgi:signal peptidase II